MACLKSLSSGALSYLRAYHVIGRDAERADTLLHTDMSSRLHTVVHWSEDQWHAKDLSRNGTWIDGIRIASNAELPLTAAQRLQFGGTDQEEWQLVDVSPPIDLLLEDSDGSLTVELDDYVVLPGPGRSHALAFDASAGGWFLYSVDESTPVGGPYTHGDSITLNDRRWSIFTADPRSMTPIRPVHDVSNDEIEFTFVTSLDEESTSAKVLYRGAGHDLGYRNQHYLLFHLARLRAQDWESGIDEVSAGWIDKEALCKDLGISPSNLNLQIHRAQKQFLECLNLPAAASSLLIEKRRGRIRFGDAAFTLYKGSSMLAQLPAA